MSVIGKYLPRPYFYRGVIEGAFKVSTEVIVYDIINTTFPKGTWINKSSALKNINIKVVQILNNQSVAEDILNNNVDLFSLNSTNTEGLIEQETSLATLPVFANLTDRQDSYYTISDSNGTKMSGIPFSFVFENNDV